MGLYPVAVCYNARQDSTVQYNRAEHNKIQHNNTHHTITYNAQDNTQHSKLRRNPEHILYTIKTQKRIEPKVDESVLKPLSIPVTKPLYKGLNYTHFTKTYTSLHLTTPRYNSHSTPP